MGAFSTAARMACAGFIVTALAGCATFTGGELVSGNAPVGEIAIQNNTNVPLNAVTISRCSAMSHGLNRLNGQIQPGRGMRWRVDAGCWDVVVGYGYGTGYDSASFGGVQISGGQRRLLTVGGRGSR